MSLATVELVGRAQAGDASAREVLFARYSSRVLDIVRIRLGRGLRSNLESTDILQGAMAEAVRSLDRFKMHDATSLIRWLSKIVEHEIRHRATYHGAMKRSAREVGIDGGDGEEAGGQNVRLVEPAATPPTAAISAEEEDVVQSCVAELPDRQREVVVLRDYAGADWQTIANECGAPSANAARMLHARALTQLGALLRARGLS